MPSHTIIGNVPERTPAESNPILQGSGSVNSQPLSQDAGRSRYEELHRIARDYRQVCQSCTNLRNEIETHGRALNHLEGIRDRMRETLLHSLEIWDSDERSIQNAQAIMPLHRGQIINVHDVNPETGLESASFPIILDENGMFRRATVAEVANSSHVGEAAHPPITQRPIITPGSRPPQRTQAEEDAIWRPADNVLTGQDIASATLDDGPTDYTNASIRTASPTPEPTPTPSASELELEFPMTPDLIQLGSRQGRGPVEQLIDFGATERDTNRLRENGVGTLGAMVRRIADNNFVFNEPNLGPVGHRRVYNALVARAASVATVVVNDDPPSAPDAGVEATQSVPTQNGSFIMHGPFRVPTDISIADVPVSILAQHPETTISDLTPIVNEGITTLGGLEAYLSSNQIEEIDGMTESTSLRVMTSYRALRALLGGEAPRRGRRNNARSDG